MTRPAPLTPAGCALQDFAFMPLDVARLRDSELASNETPESCWAAVLLWCAAWHQVPAGSIPNDEQWISKQAGYARRGRIDKEWREVREGALRGWIECSDGRLYHPVVAEKARDAWQSKLEQRWRTECARVKKHNQRHQSNHPVLEFRDWIDAGCPQGHPLSVPGDNSGQGQGQGIGVPGRAQVGPRDNPGDNASKRQGEGQGQGQGYIKEKETAAAPSPGSTAQDSAGAPPPSPSQSRAPSRPTQIVVLLRAWEKARGAMCTVTSSNPHVTAWAEHGVTDEQLREAYDLAVQDREKNLDPSGINAGFLDVFVSKVLNPAPGESRVKAVPPTDPLAWALKWSGVEAKARELGIEQQPGESSPAFKARVHAAAGVTDADRRRMLADYGASI